MQTGIHCLAFSTSSGADNGTGIRSTSSATAKNFVALYDNTAGTGQPLTVTYVESEGTSVASAVGYYGTTGTGPVDGIAGAWGTIIPNTLANGVRRIAQYNNAGTLVGFNKSADGSWPSSVNTVNPAGGTTALVISGTPLTINVPDLTYQNPPGIARIITLADIQTAGLTSSLGSPSYSITGVDATSSAGGTVIYNASNIKYTYPTSGTPASDTFNYTVSDGTSAGSGTVTITFASVAGPDLSPTLDVDNHPVVSFHGLPGYSYHIQRATTLPNWTDVQAVSLPSNGDGSYSWTDTSVTVPPDSVFYRLSYP
jgi:hypothetical protein